MRQPTTHALEDLNNPNLNLTTKRVSPSHNAQFQQNLLDATIRFADVDYQYIIEWRDGRQRECFLGGKKKSKVGSTENHVMTNYHNNFDYV